MTNRLVPRRDSLGPFILGRLAGRISVVLLLAVALVGCSQPLDRQVFSGLEGIKASAEAAMTVSGELYAAGKLTDEQTTQIIGLYRKVQAACSAAALAVSAVQTGADVAATLKGPQVALGELQKAVR